MKDSGSAGHFRVFKLQALKAVGDEVDDQEQDRSCKDPAAGFPSAAACNHSDNPAYQGNQSFIVG
jgi:hypothetical protein